MKAYVAITDSEGLRTFVPEADVSSGHTIDSAQALGCACFWAAVDEQAAAQIGEELKTGRRRDAVNLLWVLARDIVRYPVDRASHEAGSSSLSSHEFRRMVPFAATFSKIEDH